MARRGWGFQGSVFGADCGELHPGYFGVVPWGRRGDNGALAGIVAGFYAHKMI